MREKRRTWVEILVVCTLALIALMASILFGVVQVKLALTGGSEPNPLLLASGEFVHLYRPASSIGFIVPFYAVPMLILISFVLLDYRGLGRKQ